MRLVTLLLKATHLPPTALDHFAELFVTPCRKVNYCFIFRLVCEHDNHGLGGFLSKELLQDLDSISLFASETVQRNDQHKSMSPRVGDLKAPHVIISLALCSSEYSLCPKLQALHLFYIDLLTAPDALLLAKLSDGIGLYSNTALPRIVLPTALFPTPVCPIITALKGGPGVWKMQGKPKSLKIV